MFLTASRLALGAVLLVPPLARAQLDRQDLVSRHDPTLTAIDPHAPLSVGNGQFAFTADVTGLQSLEDTYHDRGIPLETMARWAWHTEPNPAGYALGDAAETIETQGRPVRYPTREATPAGQWLRRNPSDFPLGQIGFRDRDGQPLRPADLAEIHQVLDLWSGEIRSQFRWRGVPVEVSTVADPQADGLAVRVVSAALAAGDLQVQFAFPRGHDAAVKNTPPLDWSQPNSHSTVISDRAAGAARLVRRRDDLRYEVLVDWSPGAVFAPGASAHHYLLAPAAGAGELRFGASFAPDRAPSLPPWEEVRARAAAHWQGFWRSGAAVDFSGSTDPRAAELERRVVLSQYLTAIQFGGPVPPSETGLTASSWYGKHNTEMVWWHVAHFALWGRPAGTAQALAWYRRTLAQARATAAGRGLPGARWSKMVGPDGRESPGGNPLIVWNQPHPIYLAELLYRAQPDRQTLAAWSELVFATADCLAAMLGRDPGTGRYHLGPPLWIAQEIYDRNTSRDPTFELSYWAFALKLAQEWRLRLGLGRSAAWDERIRQLAPLPVRDGRYVALASDPDTWDNPASRHDHPSFLMALGPLPGDGVDPATMRRTLDAVLSSWDWETKIWGWDYPMIAMTAARLGEPRKAVDILLKDGPNNHYSVSGQCAQRGDLALYLPANGALLAAVALMVAGWDGGPPQPGIPHDGTWSVRAEGLQRLP
jgi:hypothetical protein